MKISIAISCCAVAVATGVILESRSYAQASFEGLGDIDGGFTTFSAAVDVSADGSAITGRSYSPVGTQAFHWTESNGMTGIGSLPYAVVSSSANGISSDGTTVTGYSRSYNGSTAFIWDTANGMQSLGDLPGGSYLSIGFGVSGDGSVVVGYSNSLQGAEAFRWTAEEGMTGLGDLPGGIVESRAFDISEEGDVVVGTSRSTNGYEAFIWDPTSGMRGLGDLPGSIFYSHAEGVSPDGDYVVGNSHSALGGQEAFRWDAVNGMIGLGDLPGGLVRSFATDVSADGDTVVGWSTSSTGTAAFIWDLENGMRRLREVLEADFGLDMSEWPRLYQATGISHDGRVIVGIGQNSYGATEAWRAVLGPANHGPIVTCPDTSLAAQICSQGSGGAIVQLNSTMMDTDGDPLTVTWNVTWPDQTQTAYQEQIAGDTTQLLNVSLSDVVFPVGTSLVTLTASDGIAEITCPEPVQIVITDTTQPEQIVGTCVSTVETDTDPGECYATIDVYAESHPKPFFTDLSGEGLTAIASGLPANDQFPMGETVITWTAADSTNSVQFKQTILVVDHEPPTLTSVPDDITRSHDPGTCDLTVTLTPPEATDNCGVTNITRMPPGDVFHLGTTEVTWNVCDAEGNCTSHLQTITVTNAAPVAHAGADRIVVCPDTTAGTAVTLNGAGSFDPDTGTSLYLDFKWVATLPDGSPVVFDDDTSLTPKAQFPIGSTTVSLFVTDECGETDSANVIVAVEDTENPVIHACEADREILFAPNHKLTPVNFWIYATDDCLTQAALSISSVVISNEVDDAKGDGSFTGDVNGEDAFASPVSVTMTYDPEAGGIHPDTALPTGQWLGTVSLRAERDGALEGRKYTICVTAKDLGGNEAKATFTVCVPHDQRGRK